MNSRKKILITGGSGFIGTNLIEFYLSRYPDYEILNVDQAKPRNQHHYDNWEHCDIKDRNSLNKIFSEFCPGYVIHLAAKASLSGSTMDDFPDNINGTRNVVECAKLIPRLKKFIHISTQYVTTPGKTIKNETDFHPYTPYGESKAEGEKIIRKAKFDFDWVILRPTNIWGPWHSFFPHELWRYLSTNYYIHPGFLKIKKHYGFVGNTVRQIDTFIHKSNKEKNKKVFFLTDPEIDSYDWMNGFSRVLSGNNVWRIPKFLWKVLALIGDFFKILGISFPVDSGRFFRLTINEKLPYHETIKFTGSPTFNLNEGIKISMKWIKKYHPDLIKNGSQKIH